MRSPIAGYCSVTADSTSIIPSQGTLRYSAPKSLCGARRYLEDSDDTSELMALYKADTNGKAPCHAYMDGPAYILSKVIHLMSSPLQA